MMGSYNPGAFASFPMDGMMRSGGGGNKRQMMDDFDGMSPGQAKRRNLGGDLPVPPPEAGGGNNSPKLCPKAEKEDDDDSSEKELEKKLAQLKEEEDDEKEHVPIPPSKEGIKFYSRNDVLCGRGGGTNVHPGNRRFRDLINANRRAYLKARKNDKPAISRSIVRTIREMNGRFLKKDEKSGLWFEIGDDGAREKTSQALRQRAPEMRKILFEDEQRQQQVSSLSACI